MLYVLVEGKDLVKGDAKISKVREGGYRGAVNVKCEVIGGFGEC